MKIEKIGITTGEPFSQTGCIILKASTSFYNMYTKQGFWATQESSYEQGYRKATLEEIKSNWSAIKDQWDPQPGDLVCITQSGFENGNNYVINEIYKDDPNYWRVSYLDGNSYNAFYKDQMVLNPNHGWEANSTPKVITEPQPRWRVGDYVTYKSHEDCEDHRYYYGGTCQGGYKGEIIKYGNYESVFNCFTITVMTRLGHDFSMLECEFEEWDNPNFQNSVKPEPVINKKVEYTIKDGVLRFDGHEVRVGDCVSFSNVENGINIVHQKVLKIEHDGYNGNVPIYLSGAHWCNIHKATNFVNHGQPAQLITSDIENSFAVDSRLTINNVYYPSLSVNPIKKEKSVSDYQQKPVTLYKSKTKLSLKPINLTK